MMNIKILFVLIVALSILFCPNVTFCQDYDLVYENDFEAINLTGWSVAEELATTKNIEITPVGERHFLGQFGNQEVRLNLSNLPYHENIRLTFDLFIIASWDGNGPVGNDIFDVSVQDGPNLLHATFSNQYANYGPKQSYPELFPGGDYPARTGAAENNTLGFVFDGQVLDSVYNLEFSFLHSGETISLKFSGMGLQGLSDESWGIDNLRVWVYEKDLASKTQTPTPMVVPTNWSSSSTYLYQEDFSDDFSDSDFVLFGGASRDEQNQNLLLNQNKEWDIGSIILKYPVIKPDVHVGFDFSITEPHTIGADGISLLFVESNSIDDAWNLMHGKTGGELGILGIPGLSVEIDTWNNGEVNGDPNDNHIAVNLNGRMNQPVAVVSDLPNLTESGIWHFDAFLKEQKIEIYLSGSQYEYQKVLEAEIDDFNAETFFVVLSGTTGEQREFHIIDNLKITITSNINPEPTPTLIFDNTPIPTKTPSIIPPEQNLLINGNFESPIIGGWREYRTYYNGNDELEGWEIESGSIDHIGPYWQAQNGDQSIDLSGDTPGIISQTLNTTPEDRYVISFFYAGNPLSGGIRECDVLWNGEIIVSLEFDTSSHSNDDMGWKSISYIVTVEGTVSKLSFVSKSGGDEGIAIDNVTVTRIDSNISPTETPVSPESTSTPTYTPTLTPNLITYGAEVTSVQTETGTDETQVLITGEAFWVTNQGGLAPNVPVRIKLLLREFIRYFDVITDQNGRFEYVFKPLSKEAGKYSVIANHPQLIEIDDYVQKEFVLERLDAKAEEPSIRLLDGETKTTRIQIQNLGDTVLDGLSVKVNGAPKNLSVQPTLQNSLAGLETANVDVTLISNIELAQRIRLELVFSCAQGASVTVPFEILAMSPSAQLVAVTDSIEKTMVYDLQSLTEIEIQNSGGKTADNVTVLIPQDSWLSLATPSRMENIPQGESAKIILRAVPTASQEQGTYSGNIYVYYGTSDLLKIPFRFNLVSEKEGNLIVKVEDEYTYFAAGAPMVAGATVTLTDGLGQQVAQVVTDNWGETKISALPGGVYNLDVMAEKHQSVRQTVLIPEGETHTETVFLARQLVTYRWKVEPIELEDRYRITVETIFEANVPAPVVTIEPAYVYLKDYVDKDETINFVITNHGLIDAENVRIDKIEHPFFVIEPMVSELGKLAAKEQVIVPVRIRDGRNPGGGGAVQTLSIRPFSDGSISGTNMNYQFDYNCGGSRSGSGGSRFIGDGGNDGYGGCGGWWGYGSPSGSTHSGGTSQSVNCSPGGSSGGDNPTPVSTIPMPKPRPTFTPTSTPTSTPTPLPPRIHYLNAIDNQHPSRIAKAGETLYLVGHNDAVISAQGIFQSFFDSLYPEWHGLTQTVSHGTKTFITHSQEDEDILATAENSLMVKVVRIHEDAQTEYSVGVSKTKKLEDILSKYLKFKGSNDDSKIDVTLELESSLKTQKIELNNSPKYANEIWANGSVSGEISGRFTHPAFSGNIGFVKWELYAELFGGMSLEYQFHSDPNHKDGLWVEVEGFPNLKLSAGLRGGLKVDGGWGRYRFSAHGGIESSFTGSGRLNPENNVCEVNVGWEGITGYLEILITRGDPTDVIFPKKDDISPNGNVTLIESYETGWIDIVEFY